MKEKNLILASLADLKQDIAGPIPVELVHAWNGSAKTKLDHQSILEPHRRFGITVSSDAAGLSKLTVQKSLIEVMKLVNEPKEVIYAYGSAIGGRVVGIWAADNTQMFYPREVHADRVIEQMIGAQKEIANQLTLQIGLAIHQGSFYEIGAGLFGEDADFVEEIAEEHTSGQEIVLSETVKSSLSKQFANLCELRGDLQFSKSVHRLEYNQIDLRCHKASGAEYPIPFSRDFHQFLREGELEKFEQHQVKKYLEDRAVVVAKVYHQRSDFLMEELTEWVVVNSLINQLGQQSRVDLVKSNGDLGIYVSKNHHYALDFAEDLRNLLANNGYTYSIGVAAGPVLVFPLEQGGSDIAGGAINIASKISEDIKDRNSLYIHDSVDISGRNMGHYEQYVLEKSGINLKGLKFKV